MSDPDPQRLLETAVTAARQAGQLARSMLNDPRELTQKGYRDLVTDADFAAQKAITDLVRGRFPSHGFLAEEEDADLSADGRIRWVIDPIDGTTNYSRQQPIFCVSIGVMVGEKVVAGAIYDPMQDEMFSGAVGMGAQVNGRPLHVSQLNDLGETVIGLDWSRSRAQRQAMLDALAGFAHHSKTIRAIGSAALALAWIAAGRLDGYLNFSLGPWDMAAASLLIAEAGGQLTDHAGRPVDLRNPASCLASNGRIHDALQLAIGPLTPNE